MPLKPDRSAFLDVLDWLDRPAQGVMNLARGNVGGAGRQLADFLAGPIDLLPGDLIPEFSRPEDKISGHEFLGVDRDAHPFGASLADASTALLNPLTYLGFGKGRGVTAFGKTIAGAGKTLDPLTLAGEAASAGISRLPPGVAAPINKATQSVRETLGWLNPHEDVADLAAQSDALAGRVNKAKGISIEDMFAGTNPDDRKRAFRLINNYERAPDGKAFALGPDSGGRYGTWDEQDDLLRQRLAAAPWSPEQKDSAYQLASQALKHERTNFQEAVQDFPAMYATLNDGQSMATHAPLDYTKRSFEFDQPGGSLRERSLRTTDQLLGQLNAEKPVALEEDLGIATAQRSAEQADMAKHAMVGHDIINRGATGELGPNVQQAVKSVLERRKLSGNPLAGDQFSTLADAPSRGAVDDVIKELRGISPDDARVLQTAWAGLKGPGDGIVGQATQAMGALNRWFKPAAVYGVGVPKVSAINRNIIAFPTQLAADEDFGFRGAWNQVKRTPSTVKHAFGKMFDAYAGTDLTTGPVAEMQRAVDQAFEQSGGRQSLAMEALKSAGRDDVVAALQHGVIEHGFANAETMQRPIRDSRMLARGMDWLGVSPERQQRVYDILEAPGKGFQGAEDSARSQNFFDKRSEFMQQGIDEGMDAAQAEKRANVRAAAATSNALYNYNTVSEGQQALATWVPFAKFTTNAIRQNAKFISRTPGVGTTLAGLYGQDEDEPMYPYLQEQLHIRAGRDEKGDPQYVSGLGLPVEALNQIPNVFGDSSPRALGRDVERIVGGMSQPLAKSAYGAISGHDPFFDTKFMSYDKLPVIGHAGHAGRVINAIENTGLLQPAASAASIVDKVTDPRKTPWTKALDLLTGANVVSVDPDLAVQQQLTKALSMDSGVRETSSLYGVNPDDDTASLLKELNALKSKARKARAASIP